MRWLNTEYILKGIYLGLLVFAAVEAGSASEPSYWAPVRLTICSLAGLAASLLVAGGIKVRQGYRVRGRLPTFIFFLLLESPFLVYTGILLGTLFGVFTVKGSGAEENQWLFSAIVGAGAFLGVLFGALRTVQKKSARLGLCLLLGASLVAGLIYFFGYQGELLGLVIDVPSQLRIKSSGVFGLQMLLGIPIFYLLTFSGQEEESEVEIGVMCAGLGFGAIMLMKDWENRMLYQSLPFLIPLILFFYYTMRVLPSLRILKHVLRGLSFERMNRPKLALTSLRRALQLDPNNQLARESFWSFHTKLDVTRLGDQPDVLALVDFGLCLDRAGSLLMEPPTATRLQEAERLLNLVASQRPTFQPAVDYWRAVAYTHQKRFDEATACLERILDPTGPEANNRQRRIILFSAWQLALTLQAELRQRVGIPQLALPYRRMEAIGAVEQELRQSPNNQAAWDLKRVLYQDLIEADFEATAVISKTAAGEPPVADFDYEYAQQLGLALIGDAGRWQQGAAYLRIAARGMLANGPSIYVYIAQACQRAGNGEEAWRHYEQAKKAGRSIGPASLSAEERQTYFSTLKLLGEAAHLHGDIDRAIENYNLYTEYERAGVETLRKLADLYEGRGDALSALRVNDRALVYDSANKELLERKDKYYYSAQPAELQERLETFQPGFDVEYCLTKAKSLLDLRNSDLDIIEWAYHLLQLALVVQPERRLTKLLLARAQLRRGEQSEALSLLENIYSPKPEKFASGEDEESWFSSARLLGELYLEMGKADQAVPCFADYRKSPKSGADTLYKLGQAYEQLGDHARARRCYEHVTAYEGHPLAHEARDAMYRLQSN